MIRQFTMLDYSLTALLVLILAVLGFMALAPESEDRAGFARALQDLAAIDRALSSDIYRLLLNEISHYDSVADAARRMRAIDNRLNNDVAGVSEAGAFGARRVEMSILLNQKLALLEDFKTALAELHTGLDYLPAMLENHGDGAEGDIHVQLAGALTAFVMDPDASTQGRVQVHLDALRALAGSETDPARQAYLTDMAARAEAIVEDKARVDALQQELAAIPVFDASARLYEAYNSALHAARVRDLRILCGAAAVLALVFGALSLVAGQRNGQRAADARRERDSLKESLKEARAQSAALKREEHGEVSNLSEERHIALVRNAFEIVAVLSRQDNYIYISPACRHLFGLTEKDLIGKSVYEGIHPDDLIRVKDYFARAQKELQTDQTIQYRVMDAYGKWHVAETFASNQASNPAVRGMVLNTRRLRAADEAKRA